MRDKVFYDGSAVSLSGKSGAAGALLNVQVTKGCNVRLQAMMATNAAYYVIYTITRGAAVAPTLATAMGYLYSTHETRVIELSDGGTFFVNFLVVDSAGTAHNGGAADYVFYTEFCA
jgi:hypothetical protein